MENQIYLNCELQKGKWYVSNPGKIETQEDGSHTVGIGSLPSKKYSDCIVGGPFEKDEDAYDWCSFHPEVSVGASIWQA